MSLPGRAALLLVAAACASIAAAALLVLAFAHIGRAVYGGHAPGILIPAGLLAATYVLSSASLYLASQAGACLSVGLRRRSLGDALRVDPDASTLRGTIGAHALALDAELVGSLVVTSGPVAAVGLAQALVGLAVLLGGPAQVWTLLIIGLFLVLLGLGVTTLYAQRMAWTQQRSDITSAAIERLLGLRTVSIQEEADVARAEVSTSLRRYARASRRLDSASLAVTAMGYGAGAALVVMVANVVPAGPRLAADLGAAVLAGPGFAKVCAGALDASLALVAYRSIKCLGRARFVEPRPAATEGAALLTAREVEYRYRSDNGLAPTSMSVSAGARILLAGDSGSGKSTFAEILSGRRAALRGALRIDPHVRIARVPQIADQYVFHASLLFNLLCGTAWPPNAAEFERADAISRALGLGPTIDRMPAGYGQPVGEGGWRLSSGEIARVCLARALLSEPDILVLDETLACLDPATRATVVNVVENFGCAVVVVDHG